MIVLQENASTISINGTSYNVSNMSSGQQGIPITVTDPGSDECGQITKTVSVYKCDLSSITNFTYTINGAAETGAFTESVSLSSGQTMQVTGVTGTHGMDVTYVPDPPSISHSTIGSPQFIDITIIDGNGCITNRQITVTSELESGGGGLIPGGGLTPGGGLVGGG
jgi:hypothetical protein